MKKEITEYLGRTNNWGGILWECMACGYITTSDVRKYVYCPGCGREISNKVKEGNFKLKL